MPTVLGRKARPAARMVVQPPAVERGNTKERGYDNIWRRLSERIRRQQPFCERCAQVGRQALGDVVDHKIPIADGGDRLKRSNLWVLCTPCHAWKLRIERHAREKGLIYLLPLWCDDPSERPARFR